ncbi:hypothetical protein PFISCL1PPCAC_21579, partial [Pristionchus fissidentatus]
ETMQSLLDTLVLLTITICCTLVSILAGCGKKKPNVMTDIPVSEDKLKSTGVPPAPPPTAVSNLSAGTGDAAAPAEPTTPSKEAVAAASAAAAAAPKKNVDVSDKKVSEAKKVVPGAAEDDGSYENCKDMSPDDLKKA